MASSPAPPTPHPDIPSPSALHYTQYSLLHFCSFILLSLAFYNLALIFLSSFPPWALSHLWLHPLHHPLHHLLPISLSCFSPSPTGTFFFPLPSLFLFFPPSGNSRQLVCLAADCTHARPNVETDTPPQGALDFVLPCCGTDLLTKVWGCLCASRQSAQSAERGNLCRTFWVWSWWLSNYIILYFI